jgi:hypothetical protein
VCTADVVGDLVWFVRVRVAEGPVSLIDPSSASECDCFLLERRIRKIRAAMTQIAPRLTPTPMPALAPVDRPDDACDVPDGFEDADVAAEEGGVDDGPASLASEDVGVAGRVEDVLVMGGEGSEETLKKDDEMCGEAVLPWLIAAPWNRRKWNTLDTFKSSP